MNPHIHRGGAVQVNPNQESRFINMKERKLWRLEAYDPRKSNEWKPLREIEEDQLEAAGELRDELNKINAPVVLRIVQTR